MVQALTKETPVKTLAQIAIQQIKNLGCEYGEIRLCTYRRQNLWAQDLSLKRLSDNESSGFGIRVLWQGAWGFAASHRRTAAEIERVVRLAVDIAKGSHLSQQEPVRLAPVPAYQDRYETPIELNPFDIPLTEKTELLLDVSSKLLDQEAAIKKSYSYLGFTQEDKLFSSTEGSVIEQRIYRSGGGMGCTAVADGDAQGRKYERSPLNKGFENIQPHTFYDNLERIAAEAEARKQEEERIAAEQAEQARIILEQERKALEEEEERERAREEMRRQAEEEAEEKRRLEEAKRVEMEKKRAKEERLQLKKKKREEEERAAAAAAAAENEAARRREL